MKKTRRGGLSLVERTAVVDSSRDRRSEDRPPCV